MSESFVSQMEEDTRQVLSAEFSEFIAITTAEGSYFETTGLFDKSYVRRDPGTGAAVQSENSRIVVNETQIINEFGRPLPDDGSENWIITVRNVDWYIALVRRDEPNIATVDLVKKDA